LASTAGRVEVLEGATKLSELTFCSAYGGASAKVITDRTGVSFLLLRLGEGHGTNARAEYLRIYRIASTLDDEAAAVRPDRHSWRFIVVLLVVENEFPSDSE